MKKKKRKGCEVVERQNLWSCTGLNSRSPYNLSGLPNTTLHCLFFSVSPICLISSTPKRNASNRRCSGSTHHPMKRGAMLAGTWCVLVVLQNFSRCLSHLAYVHCFLFTSLRNTIFYWETPSANRGATRDFFLSAAS